MSTTDLYREALAAQKTFKMALAVNGRDSDAAKQAEAAADAAWEKYYNAAMDAFERADATGDL